jgi:hypothetical protein
MLLYYFSDLDIWHFYVSSFPSKLVLDVRHDRRYERSKVVVIFVVAYGFLKYWPAVLLG